METPYHIQLTQAAEDDLQEIYNRRLKQRGAEGDDGADALLEAFYDAMESLIEHPHRGPVPAELEALGIAEWRQLSLWPYRMIYSVDSDMVTVAIIADSRRDFASLLERRLLTRRHP